MIVIKKFGRDGCRPCAALSNYFTEIELAEHNAELIEINTADLTDAELDAYNLTSVPVLLFERNGVEVHRLNGLRPVDEIVDAITHAKAVR